MRRVTIDWILGAKIRPQRTLLVRAGCGLYRRKVSVLTFLRVIPALRFWRTSLL